MKKILVVLALIFSFSYAEYYKVYVTRVDQNLYKTDEGVFIETRYCYEYAYSEEALLKYEDYSYDNKLVFVSMNNSCEVKRIFR